MTDEINAEIKDLSLKLISLNQKILNKAVELIDEREFQNDWTASRLFDQFRTLREIVGSAIWDKKHREERERNQKANACVIDEVSFASFKIGENVESEDKIFKCEDILIEVVDGKIKDLKF